MASYRVKSHSTATYVGFVALAARKTSAIAQNAACVSLSMSSKPIAALRISIKIIARFAEKICFPPVNLRKIYHAVMPSTPIASASWQALTIDVPFVKKQLFHSNPWQPHGRRGRGILRNIRCPVTCNVLLISCATIAKQRAIHRTGTF